MQLTINSKSTFRSINATFLTILTMFKKTRRLGGNEIAKTWISGQNSITLIIERSIAEEYDLIDPQHVILERKPDGILIRKLLL